MDKKSNRGIEIIQIVGENDDDDKLNWFIAPANVEENEENVVSPQINFPIEQLEIVKINER